MTPRFSLLAAALALAVSGQALAQKAGTWSASFGVTYLSPSVSSGNLTAPSLPGTQATVNSNTQPIIMVNYMLTDNVAIEVPINFGFKHDVTGTGAIAGAGKLADTRALPITVIGQYRFMAADAPYRPYVGAGLTYAKFYKTNSTAALTALTNPGGPPTTMSFDSKFAPTVQLGVMVNLNAQWFLDLCYTKTFLSTRGNLSTGQTLDMKLDPNTYSMTVGYKF